MRRALVVAIVVLLGAAAPTARLAAAEPASWTVDVSNPERLSAEIISTAAAESVRLALENRTALLGDNELLKLLGLGGGYSQTARWRTGAGPRLECDHLAYGCHADAAGGSLLVPSSVRAILIAHQASGRTELSVAPAGESVAYDVTVVAFGIAFDVLIGGWSVPPTLLVAAAFELLPEAVATVNALQDGDYAAALSELKALARSAVELLIAHAAEWGIKALLSNIFPAALAIKIAIAAIKATPALLNLAAALLRGEPPTIAAVSYGAVAVASPGPSPGSAAPVDEHRWGDVLISGSQWQGGFGVDVYSNSAAGNGCLDDPAEKPECAHWIDTSSGRRYAGIMWQCVELARRLWLASGWDDRVLAGPNAASIWNHAQSSPLNLSTAANGSVTPSSISHGDLVVWGTGTYSPYGHVAVVDKVEGTSVLVKEQNWDPTGETRLTVTGGWLSRRGFADSAASPVHPILGVVHHPEASTVTPPTGGVDLVFAIDTTGSMSEEIDDVKVAANDLVEQTLAGGSARIAVVEYRDYYSDCPEDGFAAQLDLDFVSDEPTIVGAIDGLSLGSGCDGPESVYSGLMTAIGLRWRDGVTKAIVLMGDAPPHDPEPITGYTLESVLAAARAVDPASIYAIDIGGGSLGAFVSLSHGSGGDAQQVASPDEAVSAIASAITTINRLPVVSAGGPYEARVGDAIVFDASASVSPVAVIATYEWDFNDDGTYDLTTSSPVAAHKFGAPFEGLVKLRVTDNGASPVSAVGAAEVTVKAARVRTKITYSGPTINNPNLPVLLSAVLTEDFTAQPLRSNVVTFTLSDGKTCTGVTDASGKATCAIALPSAERSYSVAAAYGGSESYLGSSTTAELDAFVIPEFRGPTLAVLAWAGVGMILIGILLIFSARRRSLGGPP